MIDTINTIKMYPQRVIVLINAVVAALVYYTPLDQGDMAVIFPVVNALLVLFYGEKATFSKAYLNKKQ